MTGTLFRHEALPYRGAEDFVPHCASVVRDGVEKDERVVVLSSERRLGEIADALAVSGDPFDDVTLLPNDEHGRNPSRVAALLHTFEKSGSSGRCLGVVDSTGERDRSAANTAEVQLSDAVLNLPALREWQMSIVCMVDTDRLDDDGTAHLRRSHAVVRGHETNIDYDPSLASRLFGADLPPAPPDVTVRQESGPTLGETRTFLRARAEPHGLAPDRIDDLVLAANEVITNSLRHGGGRAGIAVWFDGASIVCEVRDRGTMDDPLVGRFAPAPGIAHGRGLWLVNHLCDLVQVRSWPGGSVVRMHVDRA